MGMTMTQKILAAHAGLDTVEAGQLIEAKLDIVMANDITGPMALPIIRQMSDKVFDKDVITSPNGPIGENNNNQNTTNTNNTTPSTDSNKFCTNCGTKINDDEKFCTNCGTKLN